MTTIIVEKFIELAVLILIGAIAFRAKLLPPSANQAFSNLLLLIVSPALIITSYQIEFEPELLQGLIWALILSFLTYFVMIVGCQILIPTTQIHSQVEKLAVIYSNCGFLGIPVIQGIYGAKGIFYMTIYVAVFNIILWTHGVFLMEGKTTRLHLYRNLFSPAILSVIIGTVLFITQLKLPAVLSSPLAMIGSMNTPLAMIVAGANIMQSNVVQSLKCRRVYWIAFLRLILSPCLCALIISVFPAPTQVKFTIWIATACPTAAVSIMFAERYEQNARYASELFVITTVLSMLTMPCLSILVNFLFGLT